jgi:hypothetical protein
VIFAYARVPSDQFAAEEDVLRQMVDWVGFPNPSERSDDSEPADPGSSD